MYFTMSQTQYLGLAIFGGLIFVAVLAIAYWSYKLHVSSRRTEKDIRPAEGGGEEFSDGLQEGHQPMPLILIILIPALIIWGIAYVLAHAFGVFYAQ